MVQQRVPQPAVPRYMTGTDSSKVKHRDLAGERQANLYVSETGGLSQSAQGWIGGLRETARHESSMSSADYQHRIHSLSRQLRAEAERGLFEVGALEGERREVRLYWLCCAGSLPRPFPDS